MTLAELKSKQVVYWVIFLVYSTATTFYLLSFSKAVESEIILTSVNIAI